jgi:hypothetical protein
LLPNEVRVDNSGLVSATADHVEHILAGLAGGRVVQAPGAEVGGCP